MFSRILNLKTCNILSFHEEDLILLHLGRKVVSSRIVCTIVIGFAANNLGYRDLSSLDWEISCVKVLVADCRLWMWICRDMRFMKYGRPG